MDDATDKPANALIPQADSFGLAFGSQPLRNGLPFPKLHSVTWANEQLRKLHNIGPTPKDELRSEENVLDKLAELANRLGVKIDLSIE
jgi:hypothetical protein